MVNLVVALPAEARPLIDRYRLRECEGRPFRIYCSSGCSDGHGDEIQLIVSGVGKVAAAAATAYLHGKLGRPDAVWLNVGIAGHRTLPVGEAVIAHKIVDGATRRPFYPSFAFRPAIPTGEVVTVDEVQTAYSEAMCEMEASGFCQTALRFSSSELVHCLKVVSDNEVSSVKTITAAVVERLIAAQTEPIDALVRSLASLSDELTRRNEEPAGLGDLLNTWRFTVTQQHQLRDLLQRRRALVAAPLVAADFSTCRNAREVLRTVEDELRRTPIFE